ncbi:hypothetical protein [Clostridium sp.]|uniref:hypothetical protein n=1 Tax=Clostridium sp. TaxID=1506 RepID=UPI0035A1283D
MINPVREKIGNPDLTVTPGSLKFAKDVVAGYDKKFDNEAASHASSESKWYRREPLKIKMILDSESCQQN